MPCITFSEPQALYDGTATVRREPKDVLVARRPQDGIKFSVWERIDTDAKVCRTTLHDPSRGGPHWDMVFRRITYDLRSGKLLYDDYFDSIEALHDKNVCYRELPQRMDILTRL